MTQCAGNLLDELETRGTERTRLRLSLKIHILLDIAIVTERLLTCEAHKMVLSVVIYHNPYHMEKLAHCLNMIVVQNNLSTHCTLLSKLLRIAFLAIEDTLSNQAHNEQDTFLMLKLLSFKGSRQRLHTKQLGW